MTAVEGNARFLRHFDFKLLDDKKISLSITPPITHHLRSLQLSQEMEQGGSHTSGTFSLIPSNIQETITPRKCTQNSCHTAGFLWSSPSQPIYLVIFSFTINGRRENTLQASITQYPTISTNYQSQLSAFHQTDFYNHVRKNEPSTENAFGHKENRRWPKKSMKSKIIWTGPTPWQ